MNLNEIDKKFQLHTTKHAQNRFEEKLKPHSTKRTKIRHSSINKFFVKDGFSNLGSKSRLRVEDENSQKENSVELRLRSTLNKSKPFRSSKSPKDRSMKNNHSA